MSPKVDARLEALRRAQAAVRLDHIRRARMLARISARIDDEEAGRALATMRGRSRRWLVAAALACAALAAVIAWPRRAPLEIALPAVPAAPLLRAGEGQVVRAELAGPARVALIGPGALELVSAEPRALVVRLDGGTLLGELDGAAGRTLEIRSPGGATTRIVGTLFAIEARDGRSRVSVSHGVVEVTGPDGAVSRVEGGRTLDVAAATMTEIAPEMAAALAEHEGRVPEPPPPQQPVPPIVVPRAAEPAPPRNAAVEPSPPVAAPSPPTPAPPPPSAQEVYARAEEAMKRGDYEGARHGLSELLARFPDDRLVEPAAYDLARLAFDAGDHGTARRALDGLLARGRDAALRELARYLRCRVDLAANDPAVAACLTAFRRDYPASPHDAELLALLAADALSRADCAAAAPRIAEYLRRYPDGAYAATARAAAARCASPK